MSRLLTFSLIFLFACQVDCNSRHVALRSGRINTLEASPFHSDSAHLNRVNQHAQDQLHQFLVHVARPISSVERHQIESFIGQPLGQYIPHNTYLILATNEVAHLAARAPHVQWVGSVNAEHKLAPDVKTCGEKSFLILLASSHATHLKHSAASTLASIWNQAVEQATFEALSEHLIRVTITCEDVSDILDWIADRPEAYFVEPAYAYESHDAYVAEAINNNAVPDQDGVYAPFNTRLNGAGVVIGMADTGILQSSCFFGAGKFVYYNSTYGDTTDATGHGTAVAGIFLGQGVGTNGSADGLTPNAQLYFYDIQSGSGALSPPSDITSMFYPALDANASIFVLPFGSPASYYGNDAALIDSFVAGNSQFLVVASAGNSDDTSNRTLSSLAYSKNALIVGSSLSTSKGLRQGIYDGTVAVNITSFSSTHDTNVLSSFSSRGPTTDGRIKPDLVTVGQHIYTASSSATCAADFVQGTSYAAGVATAAASIVQNYFAQGFYPGGFPNNLEGNTPYTSPTASLIKATLISSAQPLTVTDANGKGQIKNLEWPSSDQGYGRIQLDRALVLNGTNNPTSDGYHTTLFDTSRFYQVAQTGQVAARICFQMSSASDIKATLVWTDPAASPLADIALINDLDLVLVDYYLNEYRVTTNNGDFDSLNNVEQVYVPAAANASLWAVYVYGHNVPSASGQSWSLALAGNFQTGAGCADYDDQNFRYRCPNGCTSSAQGVCNQTNGYCDCLGSFTGVDCSLTPCPTANTAVCSGNGICQYATSTCKCNAGWTDTNCNVASPPDVPKNETGSITIINNPSPPAISKGLLAGLVIVAFFIGGIIFLIIGAFAAVRFLEYKRDKAMAQRATNDEEMS